jgi:ABC-type uncharacterized transport system ATPase subunit
VVRQDLLRWLHNESVTRGATILYATHIFDGLDDLPTHLHYLRNKGCTGWPGKIGDLELYQQLFAFAAGGGFSAGRMAAYDYIG